MTPEVPVASRPKSSRRDRDRFVGFAFAAADLLIETTAIGTILFTAGARCRLTPGNVSELVGRNLIELVAPSDRKYLTVLMRRIREKARIKPSRISMASCDGHSFPVLLGGCRLDSCPGSLFLTVLLASGPRTVADFGTASGGLLEPDAFTGILEDRLVRARENEQDQALTLLLVDGLQNMLTGMPDGASEEVLQGIDAYLRGISTHGDSAGKVATDRFGIVHGADVDGDDVRSHITQIIAAAGGDLRDSEVRSWTLGVGDSDLDAGDAARALVYTVQAFASAQDGEFTIASLEDGAQRMLSSTVERVGRLRNTITKREFYVVYQPIVELDGGNLHHLEALTRLEGMTSPADFIAFAEDVGLIHDFDLILTQSVLDTMEEFRREPQLPDVAVNLSAKTLMSPMFLQQFNALLKPYGDLASKLLLEVTETVVVSDMVRLNEVLQSLRASGFRICLDDVGSGGTSFQSLYGLQVDFAKIDGQFVRGAVTNPRDMALLRSMVDVCHQLDLKLVGEQVEDGNHAQVLMDLGVPLAQGYLYGHPSRDFAYFTRDWGKTSRKAATVLRR
jgi:EAL domain-containing protein (putative c-di-GMP-specific phosphodiesterase class I)